LVRTLLESPLWSKEGYSLTWDVIPLCSRRVTTFTDTNLNSPTPSNESAETLSVSDMTSSRCLFRLRLSELPTVGTGCSSLPLMQTPTAVMTKERPEDMRARAEAKGYKNGTKYGSLESQITYDPRFKGLLKTPSAIDPESENMASKGVSGTSGTLAQEIMSGYVERRGLILPTPRVSLYKVEGTDLNNPNIANRSKRNDSIVTRIVTMEIPSDYTPKKDGNTFRLSPPVHRGNDGIPFDVDGLTVPPMPGPPTYGKGDPTKYPFGKWRTESLKAYGNAIVPQVMYRIFQTIEKITRLHELREI